MSLLDKLGIQDKLNFDDLYNKFLGLARNQQIAVSVGIAIVILVVLLLPVSCVSTKLGEREEEYKDYVKKAAQFYGVLGEYKKLTEDFDVIKTRTAKLGKDPLTAILYKVADAVELKKSDLTAKTEGEIKSELFTEFPKKVEVKNARFDQVIRMLDLLANNEELPVKIKQLDMEANPKDKQFMKKVSFTASVVEPNKE